MKVWTLLHLFVTVNSLPYYDQFSHLEGNSLSSFLVAIAAGGDFEPASVRPPHRNRVRLNFFPWHSVIHYLGALSRDPEDPAPPEQIRRRQSGPLLFWEKSPTFQMASHWCWRAMPKPLSLEYHLCSGLIDVGMGLLTEAKRLRDSSFCALSSRILGTGYPCLLWVLFRHFFSGLVPEFLGVDFHYMTQRFLVK